jgi:hypothetical protein
MQQRRKVLILASTRKKHKEGITLVEDKREEKANDNSKTKIKNKTLGHSTRRFGKKLSLSLILYRDTTVCCCVDLMEHEVS